MDRVLIVDDSATQVEWTAAILREGGFDVEVATTAERALSVLTEERFDLVVSDIIMPEMSGYELCRRIKATQSETKPPVILLSALNQPMDIIRGLECGADNFLSKPCPADLLVTRVNSLLRSKALRAERNSGVGVEVEFLGQKFDVTSSKEQILDLLVSTFEDTVRVNRELENGRAALAVAKSTLEIRNEELKSLNRTLAEAETWYHSILDCAPEAMLVITQDGRIASANTRAEELFAYAQGLEGLAIGDLIISEEDRSLYVRADGWNLPAEVSVSALPAVSGRTGYSCVTVRDISDRMRAENALRESEAYNRILFQSSAIPIVIIDPKSGGILDCNPAAVCAYGFADRDMLIGRTVVELSTPNQHGGIDSSVAAKAINSAVLAQGTLEFAWRHRRPDGTLWDAEVHLASFSHSGQLRLQATLIDVTARRLTEEKLKQASKETESAVALYRAVLEASPHGIALIDDRHFEVCNTACERMFGYQPGEMLAKPTRIIWSSDEAYDEASRAFIAVTRDGEKLDREALTVRQDGETFWCRIAANAIPGKEKNVVVIYEDVTEKRRISEEISRAKATAEEATRLKSDFLANMSHEIRTPMNAIIGMAHLALKTNLDTRQASYVRKIESSGQHLLGILNDILDFSKIEAGKLLVECVDFELDSILESISTLVAEKASEKGLEFLFDIDPKIPLLLRGDPLRLGQVLINFCNNAIKFTERGEVIVAIRIETSEFSSPTLRFSVSDTGIGLSEEQAQRLFTAFQQADTSTTRKYGGTGLGLAICKRLVELMEGEIGVSSELGRGSTFWFTIPLQYATTPPLRRAPPDLRGRRALVVEDNYYARSVLSEMLTSLTFVVDEAASGYEAIEMVRVAAEAEAAYDLVFVDWQMPGMDGIETGRRIRAEKHDGREPPPIVMVTAYGRSEVMKLAEESGFEQVLVKPVNPSMLFDVAMQALKVDEPSPRSKPPRKISVADYDVLHGAHALLVEDNELNQEVALGFLADVGITADIAANGEEALRRLRTDGNYDVVLMDMQMPVMDGLTATQHIRAAPAHRDLPIIAMTANAMTGDRERCLNAGMNDHVSKPIDPDTLFRTLLQWVKPSSAPPAAAAIVPEDDESVEIGPIAGVDTLKGRRQVGGSVGRYLRLLRKFVEQHDAGADALHEALATNDFATAERLAHTLKGTAATIGAQPLSELAHTIELGIKNRHAVELAALKVEIARVVAAIRETVPTAPLVRPTNTRSDVRSAEKAASILFRLRALLSDDDGMAAEMIVEVQTVLAPVLTGDELVGLTGAIESFDFATALSLLDAIDLRISLPAEQRHG